MEITNNNVIIVLIVASALVLSTNARSLKSMKTEDEQKMFFRRPLPPFLGGRGFGRPAFGLGPGLGFGPFGGIAGGSDLGSGGLGFSSGTGSTSPSVAGGQADGSDAAFGDQKP
ncbi:hypothetical protein HAX54_011891 [Datura stramonium]|uniref:Glycine-rich protein n=1 Tax=Datura stramonium TaxID=4076 RepID=A0ABS8TJS4_DATST|nr:hypothetical protein [Datura stramonium]